MKEGTINYLNQICNIDCLHGLRKLDSCSIDLIYLDPPFFTQKVQSLSDRNGKMYAFEDSWKSIEDYKEFLFLRFSEMKRVLKEDGSLFVHCDRNASHHIRGLLDEVFGVKQFRSEIIWSYKRWSNAKKGLMDAHQNIYFYSKTDEYKFNFQYVNYSETTNIDQIYQDRVRNEAGKTVYKVDEKGNAISTCEKKGVPLSDVWEIPYLNPKAKERVGYPTQKPIILLERIIKLCSDEKDVILDPFCGSGTTLVAAKMLNRNYIGFDINNEACQLTKERLEKMIKSESMLLVKGKAAYSTKSKEELAILNCFDCDVVQRNKGLDGILRQRINGKLVGIKIQRDCETLSESAGYLKNAMKKRGFEKSILVKTHDDLLCFDDSIPEEIHVIESMKYKADKSLTI